MRPKKEITSDTKGSGYFRKPFLINMAVDTNQTALKQLNDRAIPHNAVYLGIAGQNSLDNLCKIGRNTGRYKKAFMFDVNRRQISAMDMLLDTIRNSETPEDFITQFSKKYIQYMDIPQSNRDTDYFTYVTMPPKEKERYFDVFGASHPKYQPQTEKEIKEFLLSKLVDKDFWLSSDNYQYVRNLVISNNIKTVYLDLCDAEVVQKFKATLEKDNLSVGDFYISSIKGFMNPRLQTSYYSSAKEKFKKTAIFYDNLVSLTNDSSNFLVSHPEKGKDFLQNYEIDIASRQEIIDELAEMQIRGMPRAGERMHDHIFSAGGRQWRIMNFTNENKERYYRIFLANPENDNIALDEQTKIINRIIENINPELKKHKLPTIEQMTVNSGYDNDFFDKEREKRTSGEPSIVSCKPFQIQSYIEEYPAKTLELIEEKITKEMNINKSNDRQRL